MNETQLRRRLEDLGKTDGEVEATLDTLADRYIENQIEQMLKTEGELKCREVS